MTVDRPARRGAGNRGLALLAVLWGTMILAFIAGSLLDRTTTDLRLARNLEQGTAAALAADGAVRLEIARLAAAGVSAAEPPSSRTFRIGASRVTVETSNETGRVDLNLADRRLLVALAETVGAHPDAARSIADSIIEQRSASDAGRPFASISEIFALPGIEPGIARRLSDHLTVFGATARPSPTAATRSVRAAILAAGDRRDLRAEGNRDAVAASRAARETIRRAGEVQRLGRAVRIAATAHGPAAARMHREVIVRLRGPDRWEILRAR